MFPAVVFLAFLLSNSEIIVSALRHGLKVPLATPSAAIASTLNNGAVIAAPEVTEGPDAELKARAISSRDPSICGYTTGNSDLPYKCLVQGNTCTSVTTDLSYFLGCGKADVYRTCFNIIESLSGSCDNVKNGQATRCCNKSNRPFCTTLTFASGSYAGYNFIDCVKSTDNDHLFMAWDPLVTTTESVSTSSTGTETAPSTSTSTPTSDAKETGFSQSDKIALGVGLGVGIPSAIGALVTLYYQCRA